VSRRNGFPLWRKIQDQGIGIPEGDAGENLLLCISRRRKSGEGIGWPFGIWAQWRYWRAVMQFASWVWWTSVRPPAQGTTFELTLALCIRPRARGRTPVLRSTRVAAFSPESTLPEARRQWPQNWERPLLRLVAPVTASLVHDALPPCTIGVLSIPWRLLSERPLRANAQSPQFPVDTAQQRKKSTKNGNRVPRHNRSPL